MRNKEIRVKIPEYVADYLEECKKDGRPLYRSITTGPYGEIFAKGGVIHAHGPGYWMKQDNNVYLFAQAWVEGYEVEKEPLYTVQIPDPNGWYKFRFLAKSADGVWIDATDYSDWKTIKRNRLTESEIKKDFAWAWDAGFAKPVED